MTEMPVRSVVCTFLVSLVTFAGLRAAEMTVAINYNAPSMVSQMEIGVTHTQAMWENGHPEAVARVKKQLEEGKIRYQNQHIMGWGANNPEPSPGVYNWSSLDRRLELIRSMANTVPVITFCTAPGWMKASGKDWNMEERVADEHVGDFADLCRAVALRYSDVEYFQIWNEFKGYWIKGGRDVERFTVLYNAVYDAVKAARPDAKIGGPYLSMGGRDVGANDRQVIGYWREHSRGADFFTCDGWLEGWPPGGKTEDWMMSRTQFFGDLVKEFQTMTDQPVWISEFYGGRSKNPQFTAANHASCYYHALRERCAPGAAMGWCRPGTALHPHADRGGRPADAALFCRPGVQPAFRAGHAVVPDEVVLGRHRGAGFTCQDHADQQASRIRDGAPGGQGDLAGRIRSAGPRWSWSRFAVRDMMCQQNDDDEESPMSKPESLESGLRAVPVRSDPGAADAHAASAGMGGFKLNRRSFLVKTALGTAAALIAGRGSGVLGANDAVRIGVVGLHGRGQSHIYQATRMPGFRLAALCDVDPAVLGQNVEKAKADGHPVRGFKDVRDLIASKDIDAITIATPNHWHALAAIWACQAGKDVYVEKPVSHNVWEGRQMVEAAQVRPHGPDRHAGPREPRR